MSHSQSVSFEVCKSVENLWDFGLGITSQISDTYEFLITWLTSSS